MAPNSPPLPYDPFSDKSIQESIDSMKKDADDVIKHYDDKRYGRQRPKRMPTPIPNIRESSIDFNDLPYNIKSIVQKYDEVWEYAKNQHNAEEWGEWELFKNFWTSDKKEVYLYTLYSSINERIKKLENYLKISKNRRNRLYPRRSYPNGELNIGIVPYEKWQPMAPPKSLPLPYDPFSDKSIQKSIDSMKKDADTLETYALRSGGRPRSLYWDETRFSIATLPPDIKLLLDKYDSENKEGGYLFSLVERVIKRRIRKLENYLEKSENGRKNFYPMRSYPNGELNIGNVPRSPQPINTWRPMALGVRGGVRHRRRTRGHNKSHKKTRRVRNNRR
jgi:hypothetical protein